MSNDAIKTIGSSSVGAILGLSPWAGPWDVWARMHGLVESKKTFSTTRGHILEPAIGAHYAKLYNVEVQKGPEYEESPILGAEPWMHARPDFFVSDGKERWLVEIKSTRSFNEHWGEPGTDNVPPYYAAQCVWQMAVTGDSRCDLAAFATLSDEFRIYRLNRDKALEDNIVGFVRDWHEKHIKGGEPPETDGSTACGSALASRWKPEAKEFIPADESATALAEKLINLRSKLSEVETEKRHVENLLKEKIGEAYGIDGIATWSPTKGRSTFDRKTFESEHPELAKNYINQSNGSRIFRFTYNQPKD